jgi:hypothetical protein
MVELDATENDKEAESLMTSNGGLSVGGDEKLAW